MGAGTRAGGFTLLEVMIALAIFVAAAMALDSAMGASTRGTIRFEEKTLASWVASNKLIEMQLYQQWPSPGRQDEETEFGGRKWILQSDVSAGPLPDTRRVDISVGPVPEMGGERFFAATLTALLSKPATPLAGASEGGFPASGGETTPGSGEGGQPEGGSPPPEGDGAATPGPSDDEPPPAPDGEANAPATGDDSDAPDALERP